jgi:GTP1/Obg family GTP-binding protein
MNIEFFVSLGITVFSAGIVFGILKTDVKHMNHEFDEYKVRLDKIVDDGSPKVKQLEQRMYEMIRKDEEHDAAMQAINSTMSRVEGVFNELTKKIDELARDVKELNKR